MRKFRGILLIFGMVAIVLPAYARPVASKVKEWAAMEARAQRFFDNEDWAQASATYAVLLGEEPQALQLYSRAIVSTGMVADTLQQARLLHQALDAHTPLDSLLQGVRQVSFSIGQSNLYERFLLTARRELPWLARPLNVHLLRYYDFRRDGQKMVEYGRLLLEADPQNIGFLHTVARGEMLAGHYNAGVRAYEKVLGLDPDDYESLLALGQWWLGVFRDNRSEERAQADARAYLLRANELHPTPYVALTLKSLD